MVPMPAVVVLIVCKTIVAGQPDQNAKWTGYQNLEWATEHSMMVCQRHEMQLFDQSEALGAQPQPFTQDRCMMSAVTLASEWNASHSGTQYRVWRVACPTPIRSGKSANDPIVGWVLPDCGHRETVVCELDTAI